MIRIKVFAALISAFAPLIFALHVAAADQAPAFEHCELEGTAGNARRYAQCATFTRPESPAAEDSRQIELTVARMKASAAKTADDAVLIINGGPGGASIELLTDYWPIFSNMGRERDVLAMDQRGTGLSSRLDCQELNDTTPASGSEQQIEDAVMQCLEGLDADPRYYTTSMAVEDIEALRQALGYQQLTIYGVSYGTRVALHYLRRYPANTRALIIDGVVPPGTALGAPVVENSQQTLDSLFSRCSADSFCQENFGDLNETLEKVRRQLEETGPIRAHLRHPITGEPTHQDITYEHLAAVVRFMLYSPETAAIIPVLLDRAATDNDYTPVAAQSILTLEQLSDSLASGMHNSVVCTEDAPKFDLSASRRRALDETYLSASMVDTLEQICEVWPQGYLHEDLLEPVVADTPVLVLSGEFDPITPPAWGEAVLPGLSNSRHLIAPGQGHGVVVRGCLPRLAGNFVDDLDLAAIDASCLDNLAPFPFFIDTLGPRP